jgi:serine phosphatase RsbU (regulator of sigma subunit)
MEVEPADTSPGLGFSEELAATIDTILTMVREVLADDGAAAGPALEEMVVPEVSAELPAELPSQALLEFVDYARGYERAMTLLDTSRPRLCPDGGRGLDGLAVASRSRPWGSGLRIGGDWHDLIPLEDGWVGLVIGDAAGRGAEAAAVMSQLRTAALAYALIDGEHPARVVRHLADLVQAAEIGEMATLLYVALHPASGLVRLARAGHCPLLVIAPSGHAEYFEDGLSVPLGTSDDAAPPEAELSLATGATLLLFTDGLVEDRRLPIGVGLARLRLAAANGPADLEGLCDHVLRACTDGRSPGDDVSLLAVRRVA